MPDLQTNNILLAMILSLFLLGSVTFVSGMVILLSRTLGRDVREITAHTRKLAQKALAHDLAGIVGNASALLSATNEMVRTSSGIGVLLLLLGSLQLTASIGLALYFFGGISSNGIFVSYP